MRTYLKVFSSFKTESLIEELDEWKYDQGSMIEVTSEQFSTNSVSRDSMPSLQNYRVTEYHVAIFYRRL